MSERYVGKPRIPELRSAAQKFLSNETSRAVSLFLDGKTQAEVAKEIGRNMKAANDMAVAENLVTGRLVNVQEYALRRTERSCHQMLASRSLGVNTRKHLEFLHERVCLEAARLGYRMPKRAQRVFAR